MTNRRANIALAALAVLLTGCRERPAYNRTVIARVGDKELCLRDVRSVVPQGITGADSAAFMKVYVRRWAVQQLKLQEAERLFSSSADDIERTVEEYRQALLIRRLDRHCVDRSIDTTFTDGEIAAYYEAHKSDFRLDRTLVKGRIVRFRDDCRQAAQLKSLMGADSRARQQDFSDLCEKNGFAVSDFRNQWIDFSEFLSCLPTLRSQNYDSVLGSSDVQEMHDDRARYYFRIEAVAREGGAIPLERLREHIRRILFNRRQNEIIRSYEEELCRRAAESGEMTLPGDGLPDCNK